jgi:hypothetical protein
MRLPEARLEVVMSHPVSDVGDRSIADEIFCDGKGAFAREAGRCRCAKTVGTPS